MNTLADAFEIPTPEEITALGYVVVLEDDPAPETVKRLVRDYVLTPTVQAQLREVLATLQTAIKRGEEMGRFIHGSFGSGKSNFMFFLSLLLDDNVEAWSKDHPEIAKLSAGFRQFLKDAKILTVRLNMLSLNRPGAGFDRLAYESYNSRARRYGKPECSFLNVDGVLDEVRAEAAAYGKATWERLAQANVIPSQQAFEAMALGTEEDREALALAYLGFKKRDPTTAGVIPGWAKGLDKLAIHAKANGYGSVVFFVDELLLWLTEKQVHEFNEAVNQLSVIVDHTGGRRAVPLAAFVARQRKLSEFFPDRAQDDQIHDLFDRIAKRFERTSLEDVELRFICKGRVLRRKSPDIVQPVLERLAVEQRKILEAVIQQADVEYLKDVYPFHPALIESLIDVSALLQRERTALRLLTELLAASRDLPLGKFIPVGRAFELLIPEPGVEGSKAGEDDLKALHRLYWKSIRPALDALRNKGEEGFDDQRRYQLDQLLKTALLAEVSPRLKQGGVTLDRLVRLNDADIQGETDRGRISQAFNDVVRLTRLVPSIQLLSSGDPYGATMQVNLRGGSLAEVLERARPRVDNINTRFKTFYSLLGDALGSEAKAALQDGASAKQWAQRLQWRGTKRSGSVLVANVRSQAAAAFKPQPGEDFRILIDYPWDDQGFTVEDDRNKARSVRKNDGTFFTICWLPRHFTQGELDLLRDLAAAELIAKESATQDELLKSYSRNERDLLVSQAQNHASTLRTQAASVLPRAYRDGAVIEPLVDVPTDIARPSLEENLDSFAGRLLDRRFSTHPQFDVEPKPDALQKLCDFCVPAAEAGGYRDYGDDADLLRKLAGPGALDLVEFGQERYPLHGARLA